MFFYTVVFFLFIGLPAVLTYMDIKSGKWQRRKGEPSHIIKRDTMIQAFLYCSIAAFVSITFYVILKK